MQKTDSLYSDRNVENTMDRANEKVLKKRGMTKK